MTGGTLRHSLIASRLFGALLLRLDRTRFEVTQGGLKIMANGNARYPDLIVFPPCGDLDGDAAPDPVVVAEIVSRSTRLTDRFDKNVDYAATPSILHYVMFSDSDRSAVVCSRLASEWVSIELDETGSLLLPAIDVELPLDDIYRGLAFGTGPG